MIVTAGGIDTHIHYICPQQVDTSLFSGITTMAGGGTGPNDGTNATTCTPGPWNLAMMLKAAEEYPMNLLYYGKGNCSAQGSLEEQILAGAAGLKIHEDWGSTPAVIDSCLTAADKYDVQVAVHTDTLNEAGCVEDTMVLSQAEQCIHSIQKAQAAVTHLTSSKLLVSQISCQHLQTQQCHTQLTLWMSTWIC